MESGGTVNRGMESAAAAPPREAPAGALIVGVLLPAAADLSWPGSLAWSAALLLGAAVARASPLRWIAVAWAAAGLVPGVNAMAIIAAGLLAGRWPYVLVAAVGGPLVAAVVPVEFRTAGFLLLGCTAAVVLIGRDRGAL